MSPDQSSDYINIHRVPKQKPNTAYVSITKFSSCKNCSSKMNHKHQAGNIISMCEVNNCNNIYKFTDISLQNDSKEIQNSTMREKSIDSKMNKLCLTGKSLDPHVISTRKSILYENYLREKERRSFFNNISK